MIKGIIFKKGEVLKSMPNYISKYWIPIVLITTYLYIASKYLVNWDINLSSDTVLIGLMANQSLIMGLSPFRMESRLPRDFISCLSTSLPGFLKLLLFI